MTVELPRPDIPDGEELFDSLREDVDPLSKIFEKEQLRIIQELRIRQAQCFLRLSDVYHQFKALEEDIDMKASSESERIDLLRQMREKYRSELEAVDRELQLLKITTNALIAGTMTSEEYWRENPPFIENDREGNDTTASKD
jgi:hypothetical protein